MGFFFNNIPKVFKTKEDVRLALLEVKSLDFKERPKVFEAMVAELDSGGVTKLEFEEVVRDLRKELAISEIDVKNLKALLED